MEYNAIYWRLLPCGYEVGLIYKLGVGWDFHEAMKMSGRIALLNWAFERGGILGRDPLKDKDGR